MKLVLKNFCNKKDQMKHKYNNSKNNIISSKNQYKLRDNNREEKKLRKNSNKNYKDKEFRDK
jgi:hypothetical protein